MKIGLVYNLRKFFPRQPEDPIDADAEWDSESTILHLTNTIKSLGYDVVDIGNPLNLIHNYQMLEDVDLIFNIAEGVQGRWRESQVPSICELLNIPYTFSDGLTMAISLDKYLCKKVAEINGISFLPYWKITKLEDLENIPADSFPLFVKPLYEGTAKGITENSVVDNFSKLLEQIKLIMKLYKQPVLVEKYLAGREFTVAILGNEDPYVLGIMEVIINDSSQRNIYTYVAKEECESKVIYRHFSDRNDNLWKRIADLALRVYKAIECRDTARVDVRCDEEDNPYFLEINPLPGLHPTHSDLPIIGSMVGRSYESLIREIIELACRRYNLQPL